MHETCKARVFYLCISTWTYMRRVIFWFLVREETDYLWFPVQSETQDLFRFSHDRYSLIYELKLPKVFHWLEVGQSMNYLINQLALNIQNITEEIQLI